jgi:hypothetical protein
MGYDMGVIKFCKIWIILLVPVGVRTNEYGVEEWVCFCCKSSHMYNLGY